MAFLTTLRKIGGIATAGVAVAATGWIICEEYQKSNGLFSRSASTPTTASRVLKTHSFDEATTPSSTVTARTAVKRRCLESEAHKCFGRAKRARLATVQTRDAQGSSHHPESSDEVAPSVISEACIPNNDPDAVYKNDVNDIVTAEHGVIDDDHKVDSDSAGTDEFEDQSEEEETMEKVYGGEIMMEQPTEGQKHTTYDVDRHVGEEEDNKEDENDKEEEDEEEEDPLEQFRPVMAELDLGKLQQAALMVRLHMLQTQSGQQFDLDRLLEMSCKLCPEPMFGAFNLVYRITFSDGTVWAARVPGNGTLRHFKELDAKRMNCEYWTMRHIKANALIPIPEVYHWETTHRVGAPFALMSWVQGVPLYKVWEEASDEQRLDVLSNIAGYMSQFHKLSYDRLGMLNFDAEGNIEKVGGEIGPDNHGQIREYEPHRTLMEALHTMSKAMEDEEMHDSYRSFVALLRLAVESIPDYLGKEQRFALSPPDFNYNNIVVDPDSNNQITGFIDWDGVHAEASSAGYACYPSWITRDWDPVIYDYNEDSEAPGVDDYGTEDSPAMLSKYRQHYASEFAKLAADFDGYDPRMTRLSHMIDAVCIALTNGFCRPQIVEKLLEHAFNGTPPFELSEYADDFEASNASEKDAMVKVAFATMWHAEWEKPVESKEGCELSDTDSLMTVTTADSGSDTSSNMSSQEVEQFCETAKGPDLTSTSHEEQYRQALNLQDQQRSAPTKRLQPLQVFGRSTPVELESCRVGMFSTDSKPQPRRKTWDEELRQMLKQLDSDTLTSEKATSVYST